MDWYKSVGNWRDEQDWLRKCRYGMIEIANGQLVRIQSRPWPKWVSLPEIWWMNRSRSTNESTPSCRLYFSQPRRHGAYLTVSLVRSSWGSSFANLRAAFQILDCIAWIKQSDAILAEVVTKKISDRILERYGWVRHLPDSRRRHWIKRFYGDFSNVVLLPEPAAEGREVRHAG